MTWVLWAAWAAFALNIAAWLVNMHQARRMRRQTLMLIAMTALAEHIVDTHGGER